MISEARIMETLNGLIDDFIQRNPFFELWQADRVDRTRAAKFLATFDSLVKSFPALIAAGAARMEEETRVTLAVNLYQECGEGDLGRTHHAIYRKYLKTAGIDLPAEKEAAFALAWKTQLLQYIAVDSSPQGALGALAAGEFLAQPALSRIYSVIEPLYPDADKEYFTKHLYLEEEHVREITTTIARQIKNDDQWAGILSGFKVGLSAWETYFNRLTEFVAEKNASPIR